MSLPSEKPSTDGAETWLTAEDAAKILKVSTATIRLWTRAGRLPCARITAKTIRYRRADLDRIAESGLEMAKEVKP